MSRSIAQQHHPTGARRAAWCFCDSKRHPHTVLLRNKGRLTDTSAVLARSTYRGEEGFRAVNLCASVATGWARRDGRRACLAVVPADSNGNWTQASGTPRVSLPSSRGDPRREILLCSNVVANGLCPQAQAIVQSAIHIDERRRRPFERRCAGFLVGDVEGSILRNP